MRVRLGQWGIPITIMETAMPKNATHTTVDDKGRLLIPDAVRKKLGIEAGDLFFLEVEEESGVLRYAKA
jgi:AbrB family looped-hinge helix DNA binding protein